MGLPTLWLHKAFQQCRGSVIAGQVGRQECQWWISRRHDSWTPSRLLRCGPAWHGSHSSRRVCVLALTQCGALRWRLPVSVDTGPRVGVTFAEATPSGEWCAISPACPSSRAAPHIKPPAVPHLDAEAGTVLRCAGALRGMKASTEKGQRHLLRFVSCLGLLPLSRGVPGLACARH